MEKEVCENNFHKSFEAFQGHWICSFCKEIFTAEEIKKLMVERRQGFDKIETE